MSSLIQGIDRLTRETGINFNQAINIFNSFFKTSNEIENLFNIYIEHTDYKSIEKKAHQIKGTASNLRLDKIKEIAVDIELASKKKDLALCKENILKISGSINELKIQMSSFNDIQKLDILIVEDNLTSGKMLEQIIINFGHKSLGIVTSPEQALLSAKNVSPDLVFMDIDLSTEMSGLYTAELLSGYYSIPVVFISVYTDEKTIEKANKYGIGYVIKPYTSKEIEEMIGLASKQILNSRSSDKDEQIKLRVKEDNRIFFIDYYDVIYFEARLHTILAYTEYREFQLRSSLKFLKTLDRENKLIQTHRSFLVNKDYIEELINENYNYFLKLRSFTDFIPISKANVKTVRNIFNDCIRC